MGVPALWYAAAVSGFVGQHITLDHGDGPEVIGRVASHGTGWVSGVFGLAPFRSGAARAIDTWKAAGRDGTPRLLARR